MLLGFLLSLSAICQLNHDYETEQI